LSPVHHYEPRSTKTILRCTLSPQVFLNSKISLVISEVSSKVLKLRHLPSIFSSHAGCQLPALVKQHEQHNLRK
ncbi:11285_t:CDS:2, partial [Funneliformis geosporum]